MRIDEYIDNLQVQGKKHIVMIVTPKDEYPDNFIDVKYHKFEKGILKNPLSYISLYDSGQSEIMQYTAFRIFVKPVICDKYSIRYRTTEKLRRLNEKGIRSFFVVQRFYESVPSGTRTEAESINEGNNRSLDFIAKHPLEHFEYGFAIIEKDSNEANVLMDIDFNGENEGYYFAPVYVH